MKANCLRKLTLVIFTFVSIAAQAQITRIDTVTTSNIKFKPANSDSQPLYTYSIGIKAFSIEEFTKIMNEVDANKFMKTSTSGLFLKLNDNQISYRLTTTFFNKSISFKNECEECEEANGKLKDFSTRLGFEKNFIYGRVQPFFAFEVGYRRNSFKGDVKNATSVNYTNPYNATTLKNGFLMDPGFGVKLNLVNHITLAVETGISLLYSYEKQEKVYNDLNRTRTFEDFKKWEFLLKPLSIVSLQYNFGLSY